MHREYTIKQAAEQLKIGPRELTNKLIAIGLFASRDGSRMPKKQFIDEGFFATRLTGYFRGHVWHGYRKALVTEKGMSLINNKLSEQTKNSEECANDK